MSSELRWILLFIGVLFVAALTLWELRRPRQASASSGRPRATPPELRPEPPPRTPSREPPLVLPEIRAREPLEPTPLKVVELPESMAAVPVLEAADEPALKEAAMETLAELERESGRGAEVPDEPEAAAGEAPRAEEPEPLVASAQPEAAPDDPLPAPTVQPVHAVPAHAPVRSAAAAAREALPELPAAAPPVVEWPPDDTRRILALRLVAPQPQRFAGRSLRQALAAEGFVLGRFAIFHKPDEARRAVLSAASLNRPGTFDADTMDSQHFGGLSLFAVLPGPKPANQAFDELVFTARSLNDRLHGVLQDEQGGPLTPARIATLRERIATGAAS